MAQISGNEKNPSIDFVESSQLKNWVLDSVATCHRTPQVSFFILGFNFFGLIRRYG